MSTVNNSINNTSSSLTVNDLTANEVVSTNGSSELTSIPYSNSGTANSLVQYTASANTITGHATLDGELSAANTWTNANTFNPSTIGQVAITINTPGTTNAINVNNSSFLVGESGSITTISTIVFTNNTNANTITITSSTPSVSESYNLPDFGGNATFVLTNNTTTSMKTGTWTPVLTDGTYNLTLSTAAGYYSVIGDTVFFWANCVWSSKGSATGDLQMTLPFIPLGGNFSGGATINYQSGVVWTQSSVDTTIGGSYGGGYDNVYFQWYGSNGTTGDIQVSACSSTGEIRCSGYYRTA